MVWLCSTAYACVASMACFFLTALVAAWSFFQMRRDLPLLRLTLLRKNYKVDINIKIPLEA